MRVVYIRQLDCSKLETQEDRRFVTSLQGVFAILSTSVFVNIIALIMVIWASFNIIARERKSIGFSEKAQKTTLTNELIKRLMAYPLVQAITQFPTLWDQYYFVDKAGKILLNRGQSDDNFYKTPAYYWCWLLQFILVPSAGLWFALAFLANSKQVRDRLSRRLRRAFKCLVRKSSENETSASEIPSKSVSVTQTTAESIATQSNEHVTGVEVEHRQGEADYSPEEPKDTPLAELDEQQLIDMIDRTGVGAEERRDNGHPVRPSILDMVNTYGGGHVLELAERFGGARVNTLRRSDRELSATENHMMNRVSGSSNISTKDEIPKSDGDLEGESSKTRHIDSTLHLPRSNPLSPPWVTRETQSDSPSTGRL